MSKQYIFIYDNEWLNSGSLKNPIPTLDHKLEAYFPEFYETHYELRIVAAEPASLEEKNAPFYNDYREHYGVSDISSLDDIIKIAKPRSVFLNGFDQKLFLSIAPKLMDTVEVIYFFKCPKIKDLSILSQFSKLRCVHIYWNHSLETLWDMKSNPQLKVLSCTAISKLRNVDALKNASVEYVHLDSLDHSGNKKNCFFDTTVFDQMQHLKHLSLNYKDCFVDR